MKTKIQLIGFFTVMAMCLTANRAVAQNYSLTHSSGTETITLTTTNDHKFQVNGTGPEYDKLGAVTVTGGTLNIVFDNTDFIYLAGTIKVEKGTLNLSLGDNYTTGHPTIMRASNYKGRLFFVESTDSEASNCKLNIQGEAGKRFIIDGNSNFQVVGHSNGTYSVTQGNPNVIANYAIICSHGGVMDLDYVTLQKNWNGQSTNSEGGGAMNIYDYEAATGSNSKAKCESIITMDSCVIDACYAAGSGAVMRIRVFSPSETDTSSIVMNKCVMRNCYSRGLTSSQGGVIRTWGMSKCNLEMHRCVVEGNYNFNYDNANMYGVLHWSAFQTRPLVIDSCVIDNNWSRYHGGGMCIMSMATITNSRITNNKANRNGGGIYYTTYSRTLEDPNLVVGDGSLELDENTVIEGNSAQNGGGLYILVKPIENGTNNYINDPTITINLNVNGATIKNNVATMDGGGVYMSKDPNAVYQTAVNLNYGEVDNNQATQHGGGIFVNRVNVNVGSNSVDSLKIVRNEAVSGGGIYLTQCDINITNGYIGLENKSNISTGGDGGGIYVYQGNLTMTGGDISYNQAKKSGNEGGNAGAFYVNGGSVVINSGSISYNTAEVNGGAIYALNGASDSIVLHGGTVCVNSAAQHGGGIYIASGNVTMDNGIIALNEAQEGFGGGLYLGNGSMNVRGNNSAFIGNHSYDQGGGIHLEEGAFTMTSGTIGGTTVEGNYTDSINDLGKGGGLYVGNGTASISGGAISGNHSVDCGGGIYINAGVCTLSEGVIIGGEPDYSNDLYYTNRSKFGGGIYSAGGIITLLGGKVQYNEAANDGGGIYSNGSEGVINVQKQKGAKPDVSGYIEYNTAQNGGGIYANRGTVNFSDGYIQYNYASKAGGGIYVGDNGDGDYGKLFLKGSAQLIRNHVPTGKKGGGVYLDGVAIIGDTVTNSTELGVITAKDNFAYTTSGPFDYSADITNDNRNNVFLPDPEVDTVHNYHKVVITVIENGISDESEIGFSVPRNLVPVIYCALSDSIIPNLPELGDDTAFAGWHSNQKYLHQFSTGWPLQNNLFDDTHHYFAIHSVNQPEIFDPDHVYLYGVWTNIVITDPTGNHTFENTLDSIDTPEKLAYFISWVNGINDVDTPHPDAVGTITADIDMSAYGWVPIGNDLDTVPGGGVVPGLGFTGVLHGNGHTITGINSMLFGNHLNYGIIGKLNGGTVEDLFVKDAEYVLEYKDGLVIGGLVGETQGGSAIKNCEVSASMLATHPNTIVGGLVGRTNTATDTIHSSIGIADMTGYLMGGLVGDNKGVLLNSFANAKFTCKDSGKYVGGLVGENSGKVENCYVRLRGDAPTNDHFGWLVGQNNSNANVNYCYTRDVTGTPYYASNAGSLNGCGYYANNTQTPYLYARRDNQVTIADGTVNNGSSDNSYVPLNYDPNVVNPEILATGADKQMMFCLNNWVSAQNGASNKFTYWYRPTTKVINDDLPVLRMPSVDAVACTGNADGTENETFLNYDDVNDLIAAYPATADNAAIWLYKNKNGIDGNANSGAKLYIAEGVTVFQNAPLNAYVGVTLLNKGGANGANPTFGGGMTDYTDWHMFSSPLYAAPLGVNYTDTTQYLFSYGHSVDSNGNPMPYYHFYDDEANRGYFPSHRYDTIYGEDTGSPTAGGNYYQEWDYYTYYEPEYHWINFKRNSNSHWHENAHDAQIYYNNESTLTRGKGYLLATREETFLQCYGRLNSGEVPIRVTYSGYYSPGYNLLGNPYLAYLDFDAFVDYNLDDLWGNAEGVCYGIIDESPGAFPPGYRYYAYHGSRNDYGASQYIAPHQGFMIRVKSEPEGNADFEPDMCSLEGDGGVFRGNDRPDYPLVNLFAIDGNNNRDITTVELGRPDRGGAKLMRELKWAKCHVYCRYEGEDWTIAFTQPGLTEAAIRFEAYEDGEFTMKWDAENGEFHYLHLIDNMTGADVDCLAETEYRFTATTEDFRSRFRLVFGYTGIEEEEVESQEVTTFAFQSGDDLVVNGEGTLTMYDVTGRAMMNVETYGTQTVAPLPDLATGVYLLRLETVNGTKVQKIVIK